jgi:hypothetical protein
VGHITGVTLGGGVEFPLWPSPGGGNNTTIDKESLLTNTPDSPLFFFNKFLRCIGFHGGLGVDMFKKANA